MPRPKFIPTPELCKIVKSMSAFGIPQEDIAIALEISPHTLRKHFRKELNRGAIEANMQVLNTLFKMATSGNAVAATIFWAKTRCGLRERSITDSEVLPPHLSVVVEGAGSV